MQNVLHRHWRAINFQLTIADTPLDKFRAGTLIVLHIIGCLALARLSHVSGYAALPILLFLIPAIISYKTANRNSFVSTLTPMILVYGVVGIRVALSIVASLRGTEFILPTRLDLLLNYNTITTISVFLTIAIQTKLLAQAYERSLTYPTAIKFFSLVILTYSVVWASATYLELRSHGATGSDPYAYVQMGQDFADNFSLEHEFELITLSQDTDLVPQAFTPIGYIEPEQGDSKLGTVWAPGFSVIIGLVSLAVGEVGFYLVAPIMGILSIIATAWLGYEIFRDDKNEYRWLAGTIGGLLLATSQLQILWLAVPMADIPSQLFTILALIFALRTKHHQPITNAFVAGVCLGVAFGIRYTQVLAGVAIVYAISIPIIYDKHKRHQWLKMMASAGIGAWLVAGWVLKYHNDAFGSPLTVGSEELDLFSLSSIPTTAQAMFNDLMINEEFFWFLPFIIWGAIIVWHKNKHAAIVLYLTMISITLFHLPYAALRLRDLLSLFPILALWTGIGVVNVLLLIKERASDNRKVALQWLLILFLIAGFTMRTANTFAWTDENFNNFGYLQPQQRESFVTIAEETPENAVIAGTLNAGAVMLYSDREIVRPSDWEFEDWFFFIEWIAEEHNRPVYLLRDGVDIEPVFDITRQRYTLELITVLPMPYFYVGGGSLNQDVELYQIIIETR